MRELQDRDEVSPSVQRSLQHEERGEAGFTAKPFLAHCGTRKISVGRRVLYESTGSRGRFPTHKDPARQRTGNHHGPPDF